MYVTDHSFRTFNRFNSCKSVRPGLTATCKERVLVFTGNRSKVNHPICQNKTAHLQVKDTGQSNAREFITESDTDSTQGLYCEVTTTQSVWSKQHTYTGHWTKQCLPIHNGKWQTPHMGNILGGDYRLPPNLSDQNSTHIQDTGQSNACQFITESDTDSTHGQ